MGDAQIRCMSGVLLVNCARGGGDIFDEEALVRGLESEEARCRGAGRFR